MSDIILGSEEDPDKFMDELDAAGVIISSEELQSLSGEGLRALPGEYRRNCSSCGHLTSALSWWCSNKRAIKARGTSIPAMNRCPYWKPVEEVSVKGFFSWLFGV